MRDRRDPWKWPVTLGLTVGLLWTAVFVLPRSWLDFLLAPRAAIHVLPDQQWPQSLILLPALVVEVEVPTVVPERRVTREPPEPAADPRWWIEGWAVKTVQDEVLFTPQTNAAPDAVALVLKALGVGQDLLARARPDSVLATRLFMLRVEDSFRYEELKPYLTQLARSRNYSAILARAADMYGEHLSQEIQVPK